MKVTKLLLLTNFFLTLCELFSMLLIQEGDSSVLPKRYRAGNNICAVLYDQLVEIVKSELYKPLLTTHIKFQSEDHAHKATGDKSHILDFLRKNDYIDDLHTILIKQITHAVLSDQANFIYESISSAQSGKMTVAYTLLRKPFKDELLILENLYVDPEDFIQRFYYNGAPSGYDPSKKTAEERKTLIRKAVEQLDEGLFNAEQLYEFRYNKDSTVGISGFTDHAIHIVTTNKSYHTSPQDLNFVFSQKEDFRRYWQHYYFIVPYLLSYTAAIADGIVFRFIAGDAAEKHKFLKELTRLAGFILWFEKCSIRGKRGAGKLIQHFQKTIKLQCTNCKQS
ncbi:hypothetical protein [Pseudoflavitalea rhizosphaerae]|uniref:hypothetical protein n=1 Tax=Pseudoflavitalea rhizosphaerae TaxID=1884793 RepID=UPI000F8C9E8B|nr:hypothetical protein [Pseudoflavitalea rhizosphaerae]